MRTLQRRRLLRTFGTLAAAGAAAGCIDGSPVGAGGDGDDRMRGDGVVDYPGMVDGEASVSADERTIEYEDPEATFELIAGYRGEEAEGTELRVGRDLSGDTMAAFVAPAATEEDGAFEYHVFGNEAFVEFADWNVVATSSAGGYDGLGEAGFEHLGDDVYGTVVDPGDVEVLLVVDGTADALEGGSDAESTGIGVQRGLGDTVRRTAPNVNFQFDYDLDAERLEVTHAGGDGVDRDELRFDSQGDVTVLEDFESETVRAGSTAKLSASTDASVRVVWEDSDGDTSATLARWRGPDY